MKSQPDFFEHGLSSSRVTASPRRKSPKLACCASAVRSLRPVRLDCWGYADRRTKAAGCLWRFLNSPALVGSADVTANVIRSAGCGRLSRPSSHRRRHLHWLKPWKACCAIGSLRILGWCRSLNYLSLVAGELVNFLCAKRHACTSIIGVLSIFRTVLDCHISGLQCQSGAKVIGIIFNRNPIRRSKVLLWRSRSASR